MPNIKDTEELCICNDVTMPHKHQDGRIVKSSLLKEQSKEGKEFAYYCSAGRQFECGHCKPSQYYTIPVVDCPCTCHKDVSEDWESKVREIMMNNLNGVQSSDAPNANRMTHMVLIELVKSLLDKEREEFKVDLKAFLDTRKGVFTNDFGKGFLSAIREVEARFELSEPQGTKN